MRFPLFALMATLAAGCSAALLPGALLPGALHDRGPARIELRAAFAGDRDRTIQSVVTPYSSEDVNHVVFQAFTVVDSTETPASGAGGPISFDVAQASLSSTIVLDGMKRNTKYRVRGYAYATVGTASADLLSIDADSFLDVDVTNDDRPTVATLSIQLKTKAFSAQATSSLDVKTGTVTDVGGEFITKGSPS